MKKRSYKKKPKKTALSPIQILDEEKEEEIKKEA